MTKKDPFQLKATSQDFPFLEKIILRVGQRSRDLRIDQYLRKRVGKTSRASLQKAIREGRVFLNECLPKSSSKVFPGDQIVFYNIPKPSYLPQELNFQIVYEDDYILAVNKPSGMSMHPGPGHKGDTLADGLIYYQMKNGASSDVPHGTVHRLDLPTSGLVLAGKTKEIQHHLGEQFAERTIQKEYLALVWGDAPPYGIIDGPLTKYPGDRFRWKVELGNKDLKPAKTAFEKKKSFPRFSFLHVFPQTGRTHQIRAHLTHIGHPILGDPLYGKPNFHLFQNHLRELSPKEMRLCLHAHKLTFIHPNTKKEMTLQAPLLEDFKRILKKVETLEF